MTNLNATFARVKYTGKAVVILGVWEKEGFAKVRYASHIDRSSFKIALYALVDF